METSKWLMQRTHRWPRPLRHTLTDRVENLTLGILEDITTAAYHQDRDAALMAANDRLNRLRVLLRLAHELEALSHGHYEEASRRLSESGRLLGAWMQRRGLQRPSTQEHG